MVLPAYMLPLLMSIKVIMKNFNRCRHGTIWSKYSLIDTPLLCESTSYLWQIKLPSSPIFSKRRNEKGCVYTLSKRLPPSNSPDNSYLRKQLKYSVFTELKILGLRNDSVVSLICCSLRENSQLPGNLAPGDKMSSLSWLSNTRMDTDSCVHTLRWN